jgi:uroporphyrinogen-III decarboxylase
MKDSQWEALIAVMRGEQLSPLPTGFIIDSPWLPNWAGHTILDYFTSERIWFESHQAAHAAFPDTWFLPGFWSEYGMCTEPSAFGAVSMWTENEFPFAKRILNTIEDVDRLEPPNPRRDGLLPFVVKRLVHYRSAIERSGYKIRFAVARGPLNIASFLMGTTEFLTAIKTEPTRMHHLLNLITDFLVEWIAYQREAIPTIDGVLVLDDLVGFVGKSDFQTFALPYLKRVFALDVSVKFFHNDAPCKVAAPFLPEVGINMLNFGIQHSLSDMKAWTQNRVTLLGNVPPRDVLAQGTAEQVRQCTRDMLAGLSDRSRLIVSCAGGMPPGAPSANIAALIDAARGA